MAYHYSAAADCPFIYLAVTGNTINIISLSFFLLPSVWWWDDVIVVLENKMTHIERFRSETGCGAMSTNHEVAISVIASH